MKRPLCRLVQAIRCALFMACALTTASPRRALAEAPSTYEESRVHAILASEGLELEPHPEGRRIRFIRIARDDVFIAGEVFPTFFNIFHWKTRRSVVERELLLTEGDLYDDARIEESMRNLRSLGIFSFVRIVPVRSDAAGTVGLLVHTRDLWSLRLEQNFQLTGDQLNELLVQLTERNLFGRQKAAVVRFFLVPDTYRLGQVYQDRRLGGGTLSLAESGDLIFNRDSGQLEGGIVAASVGRPFFHLKQRHSYTLDARYATFVRRNLRNGQVVGYDNPETEAEESIASVWRQREVSVSLMGLLRRGHQYKQTFGAGLRYDDLSANPNAETALAPEHRDAFIRDVLPRERRQIGPAITYQLFTPEFMLFENLGTFGQTETVRVGPEVSLSLAFPVEPFGSTTDSVVLRSLFRHVVAPAGGLLDARIEASSRLEEGAVVDQILRTEIRGATPFMEGIRLVGRVSWEGRRHDTSRAQVSLGGDNGLRGFISQAFTLRSGNLFRVNLELRTRPVVWHSIHVGGVLFYDFGSVYHALRRAELHHGAGLGLRILMPQFNRLPYAVDLGVPVEKGLGTPVPSVGGSQVIPLTAAEEL